MSVVLADAFEDEVRALNINDSSAVRALAIKLEELEDPPRASELCAGSNALRRALGQVRADILTSLLARDARQEFIKRSANAEYMSPVDVNTLRIPRYLAVQAHRCECACGVLVPFARQGGPEFIFDCPACAAPYIVRSVYDSPDYYAEIEIDTRPAKKRRRRERVL